MIMHFSTILLSLLTVTSALPLTVAPRQQPSLAPKLLETIQDLNGAVTELTAAVNAFDGSLLGLIPQLLKVVATEAKVDATTVKATFITKQSGAFTADESSSVVNTLATQIGPIQDSLNALTTKVNSPPFLKRRAVKGADIRNSIRSSRRL